MTASPPPLLVTLTMEDSAFAHFQALRQRHFPPERNFLPAHITLFHHLPGHERDGILETAKDICGRTAPFPLKVERLWLLGKGVAYRLASPQAQELRARLAAAWAPWLTPQDQQQGFVPHITVQNKTTPEAARRLHAALAESFTPFLFQATGADVWEYLQGPWRHLAHVRFKDNC